MACSGAHCTSHSTGTTTCVYHRPANYSARYLTGGSSLGNTSVGVIINATTIDKLRKEIYDEIVRWNQHANYNLTTSGLTSSIAPGQEALNTLFNTLRARIRGVDGINIAYDGDIIDGDNSTKSYNALIREYREMKSDCICNSDCACNAVCACHNDCGCNYSDERLKKDIGYC